MRVVKSSELGAAELDRQLGLPRWHVHTAEQAFVLRTDIVDASPAVHKMLASLAVAEQPSSTRPAL